MGCIFTATGTFSFAFYRYILLTLPFATFFSYRTNSEDVLCDKLFLSPRGEARIKKEKNWTRDSRENVATPWDCFSRRREGNSLPGPREAVRNSGKIYLATYHFRKWYRVGEANRINGPVYLRR